MHFVKTNNLICEFYFLHIEFVGNITQKRESERRKHHFFVMLSSKNEILYAEQRGVKLEVLGFMFRA